VIDEHGNIVDAQADGDGAPETPHLHKTSAAPRVRKPLGEVLRMLRAGRLKNKRGIGDVPVPVPDGARFLSRSFTSRQGARDYKLYIPACDAARVQGLIVMLHGCKQHPDDFAAGTNMNAVAEVNRLIVAYPAQSASANALSCWNWFSPPDQLRDSGEPSIIAGITHQLIDEFSMHRDQVFVAGLSAGGAMAVVLGETYPDLFSAIGVHSGLPYRSANDVVSAFAAMRGEVTVAAKGDYGLNASTLQSVRLIVFQGEADQTVHFSNAERIVASARPADHRSKITQSRGAAGQRHFTRTTIVANSGECLIDYWLIDGAGHAWSGGHPSGSYTDIRGPDASKEMVRFFLSKHTG
jgi:poly(hydroxyalkanoate) depolymerase family esterase